MIRMLRIILGLLLGLRLSATTYFVDYAGGSDSNDGLSTSTPFKRCPGDTAATGTAAVTAQTSNTFVFKGGVVYVGGIFITNSSVVLAGATNGAWGTSEKAVIDANYVPGRRCIALTANMTNITVVNFELRNSGGYADDDPILEQTCFNPVPNPVTGYAIYAEAGGNNNLTFKNLYIHRIGQWRNQPPFEDPDSINGTGITLENCNGVTIDACEFTKMGKAIAVGAQGDGDVIENVLVQNCVIHDYLNWGIDVVARSDGAILRNLLFRKTTIRDMAQYDSGNWRGCGEPPHQNGFFFRNGLGYDSFWTNVVVDSCLFYSDYPGNSAGGTGSIWISFGPSVNIWNNRFLSDSKGAHIAIGWYGGWYPYQQKIKIFNNTFLDGPAAIGVDGETNGVLREYIIKNNVYMMNNGVQNSLYLDTGGAQLLPAQMDRDLLWDGTDPAASRRPFHKGLYYTLAQFQSIYGVLADNSVWGNPLFYRAFGLPSQRDVHIQSGSAARNMGENLSAYFTMDADCYPRPSTGPWDVGAYIYRDTYTTGGADISPGQIVVDNSDVSGFATTGSWTTSTGAPGYNGANYLHDGNTAKGTKTATFTPTIPTTGAYQVLIWYASDSGRATNVPLTINHVDGPSSVTVNQRINGSSWFPLGVFTFNSGTGGNVVISTTGTDGFVIADAVKFVPVP